MIPYDVDPSLHTAEPAPVVLDDGFSPPQLHEGADTAAETRSDAAPVEGHAAKSPY